MSGVTPSFALSRLAAARDLSGSQGSGPISLARRSASPAESSVTPDSGDAVGMIATGRPEGAADESAETIAALRKFQFSAEVQPLSTNKMRGPLPGSGGLSPSFG